MTYNFACELIFEQEEWSNVTKNFNGDDNL
jgi:hypothetical protein